MSVEKELQPARDVGAARARHRIEDDRCFLALKLVDGSHANPAGNLLTNGAYRHVVRSDNENVVGRQAVRRAFVIDVGSACEQVATRGGYDLSLFARGLASPVVVDGYPPQTGAGERAGRGINAAQPARN